LSQFNTVAQSLVRESGSISRAGPLPLDELDENELLI
jgi:hypothetical protein